MERRTNVLHKPRLLNPDCSSYCCFHYCWGREREETLQNSFYAKLENLPGTVILMFLMFIMLKLIYLLFDLKGGFIIYFRRTIFSTKHHSYPL